MPASGTEPGKPKILIITDNTDELVELADALLARLGGVLIDTVASAGAALEQIASQDYDAILSATTAPQLDSFDLPAFVKIYQPATPTVLLIEKSNPAILVDIARSGAYDWIPKPVDLNRLESVLRRAIQVRALRLQAQDVHLASKLFPTDLVQEHIVPGVSA